MEGILTWLRQQRLLLLLVWVLPQLLACQQQSECFRYTDGMSLTSPVEGFPLPGYSEPHVVSEPDPNTKHCEQHNRAYVKSCPVCVSDESTT